MFNTGDKAIVRSDLTDEEKKEWPEFVAEMERYAGKEITIKKFYSGSIGIEEDNGRFVWLESWFIPSGKEKFDAASSEELMNFLGI